MAENKRPRKQIHIRHLVLGNREKSGVLFSFLSYALLIGFGFVYLYPLIYMVLTSLMSAEDLIDSTVSWIPTSICFDNYIKAFHVLDFWNGLKDSVIMTAVPAFFQMMVLSFVAYGLARYPVPFKPFWIVMIVATFIIPAQVTLIPRYILFNSYHIVKTVLPNYVTALFGQGMKSAIFILVYYQFFSAYPKALDEAAQIDGAGRFKVFWKVALPMAKTAMVVTFLFSFIWYWNETAQTAMYSGNAISTLPMNLARFQDTFTKMYPSSGNNYVNMLSEGIKLTGTFLSIIPLLLLFTVLQKQFIEGIERTGITGE